MRCFLCGHWSWKAFCPQCIRSQLQPQPSTRTLDEGFNVYSFFPYEAIAPLLHSKHHLHGSRIYKALADVTFTPFLTSMEITIPLSVVPVDDHVRVGYSHTAILAKALTTLHVTPYFNVLRAKNPVSYSGKSLRERQANPRDFTCTLEGVHDIILVDDLVTTGLTLKEAKACLETSGHTVLFALTLADAKNL